MEATRRLTLRLYGLTALVAVASFWAQLPGLIGSGGIWPAALALDSQRAGGAAVLEVPTLAWLSSSDLMLHALCAAGCLASVLVAALVRPRLALVVLYVSWLSLIHVGGPFLAFQWDILLAESALALIPFAGPFPRPWARALVAFLAVKVTLSSGLVKLLSGDESWRDLTALTYHWWTQPLPTWSSVLLARLPLWAQQGLCGAMFMLELGAPVLALGPRRARLASAAGMIALQVGLFAAGNYSYFNVLTAALCLPLLDDRALAALRLWPVAPAQPRPPGRAVDVAGWALAAAMILWSALAFTGRLSAAPRPVLSALERLHPFLLNSGYGAFAVMTKTRPEIVLEGSRDGVEWTPYEFPWKPGALTRRPAFVAPLQPRLDWQMWFAALGDCGGNPWLVRAQQRLLEGAPEVEGLFASVPPNHPNFLRTRVFEYRFAPPGSPAWWTRTETGPYCPVVTLDPQGRLVRAQLP
ncbi:MAG: lipase maturation factor family protein [Myxococcaceae bacterium]|nr:lipase maturation factor family protein [Myxococcaceae bacterium]